MRTRMLLEMEREKKKRGKTGKYHNQYVPRLSFFSVHVLTPAVEWPPASPFDALAYPKPWPIQPFSMEYPNLQKYILYSHLPTTLKVHDPWNLLRVAHSWDRKEREEEKTKQWSDKNDVVNT